MQLPVKTEEIVVSLEQGHNHVLNTVGDLLAIFSHWHSHRLVPLIVDGGYDPASETNRRIASFKNRQSEMQSYTSTYCLTFSRALHFLITPGNGVCPGPIKRSPTASSPPRQQHAKPNHAHANGRARLSSRSGSVSYAGSPRPSLSRQPSAATDVGDGSKPNDYLIWAILACLCPVWPINIVGLTFSVMVCAYVFTGWDCGIQFLSSKTWLRFHLCMQELCQSGSCLALEIKLKTFLTTTRKLYFA